MKVYLGSDHQGFHLKEKLMIYLSKRGVEVEDVGDRELKPDDDFPEFAGMAAIKLLGDDDTARAILICGGGQGMAIAANRFRGIRAVVIWNQHEAKLSRNDNDANVLCLPAHVVDNDDNPWRAIVDTWLDTPFAGAARYVRRNRQLDELA
ncbi:MAG TPA: RpiB/LacA/LacB family sugar-phosphate isomerase [Candidatus Saccharimonadales bacterium]|nr:RpiB/LacA/LacB family sugar-phosphate isomerase [Candidatus Saccharimonadales bacterium]